MDNHSCPVSIAELGSVHRNIGNLTYEQSTKTGRTASTEPEGFPASSSKWEVKDKLRDRKARGEDGIHGDQAIIIAFPLLRDKGKANEHTHVLA